MKTTILFRYVPAALVFVLAAGCQRGAHNVDTSQTRASQAAQQTAQQTAQPQPGAQGGGGYLAQQNAGGGEANALGLPGAAAAQTQGQPDLRAGQQLATSGTQNGVTACAG